MRCTPYLDVTSEECTEKVRQLDPLRLDEELRTLPKLNDAADTDALACVLRQALPSEETVASFTPPECLAAMRDLGMYIGSIKRHGLSAFEVIPHATGVFEQLGNRTHMIPRDTVYHYTCWNPVGERERLYTGRRMERSLIGAVRSCVPELARAVDIGSLLGGEDAGSPGFAEKMECIAAHITAADRAMGDVLVEVTPEFFALELRPYFEDIDIAGRRYMGPAAAHIPLFLVDLLLWASDRSGAEHLDFCREVASQTLPDWQDRYAQWTRLPSVATRVAADLGAARSPADAERVRAGAQGVRKALRSLTSFRGKHLVMARRAYHSEVRLYELGSGGGSVELLAEILALTRQNAAMINTAAGR